MSFFILFNYIWLDYFVQFSSINSFKKHSKLFHIKIATLISKDINQISMKYNFIAIKKFNNSHQRGKMTNVKVLEEALLSYHHIINYVNYFRVIKCSSTKWKNNNTLPVHDYTTSHISRALLSLYSSSLCFFFIELKWKQNCIFFPQMFAFECEKSLFFTHIQ